MNVIAKISWYLECSVVTLKLRKEYLNTVTHNTPVLVWIKYWTDWYIDRYSMSTYTGVTNFQKTVRFFWPTLYNYHWVQHRNSYHSPHISHQKQWLRFMTPQGHPRSNLIVSIESPWLLSKNSSLGSNLVSVTVFKIFRIKGLWPWPLTSQGHPKWSPMGTVYNLCWVQHRNSCCSGHISCQKVWLIFDPSRSSTVKFDSANGKPVSTFLYDLRFLVVS